MCCMDSNEPMLGAKPVVTGFAKRLQDRFGLPSASSKIRRVDVSPPTHHLTIIEANPDNGFGDGELTPDHPGFLNFSMYSSSTSEASMRARSSFLEPTPILAKIRRA